MKLECAYPYAARCAAVVMTCQRMRGSTTLPRCTSSTAMPAPRPSLLLLDFDGVLASYARPKRMAALAAMAKCTPAQVHAVLFAQGLERSYDSGDIDTPTYLARLSDAVGQRIDPAAWVAARVAACRADTSVMAQVLAVSAHTPVAVLTNNGPLMVRGDRADRAGAVPAAARPGAVQRCPGRPQARCTRLCTRTRAAGRTRCTHAVCG